MDFFFGFWRMRASAEKKLVEELQLFQKSPVLSAVKEMSVILSYSVQGHFTVSQWADRVLEVRFSWVFLQLFKGLRMEFSRKCLC